MVFDNKMKEYIARVEKTIPEILRCIHIAVPKDIMGLKLTISQSTTLTSLGYKKSCKMSELAESVSMNTSTMTSVVDSLIEIDLLRRMRSREDRRLVLVQLTEKGKKVVNKLNRYKKKQIRDIIEHLNEKDRENVLSGFEKVVDAFLATSKEKKRGKKEK